jgi:hypothetical protein
MDGGLIAQLVAAGAVDVCVGVWLLLVCDALRERRRIRRHRIEQTPPVRERSKRA